MSAEHWSLRAALGIGEQPEIIAFVGGGGKTSLMFALAGDLPGRVVLTTTTRIFAAQMKRAPAVVYAGDLSSLGDALDAHDRCLVVGRVEGEKALGVSPDLPARLLARPDVDYVLVEADGSRMRPVKAPAAHEPVMPLETTIIVLMAGMDALEKPLDEAAHRPELVREITNDELRMRNEEERPAIQAGRLTAAGLARVLVDARGGLKDAPVGARVVPFLNKVETAARLAAAREAAGMILTEPRISRVVLGALQTDQPAREVWRRVAAVVLAAGESRRMGRNKLLLPWGDSIVLGRTLDNVAVSGVTDVFAVIGFERDAIEAVATQRDAIPVFNENYAKGMLSSVQAAVHQLPLSYDAILVMLGDQPLVATEIIDQLLQAYAATAYGLVAPTYQGRRGNPVIIDRRYFPELLALPPEAAPRALLERHAGDLHLVDVVSDAILLDLDRPEDYERLRPR